MKIQKKFIVKMISVLCATCAIATTAQPLVSANSPKNISAGQVNNNSQNANTNQNVNEIINNNQNANTNQNVNEIINNNQNANTNQNVNEIINNNQNAQNNHDIGSIKMYTTNKAINENILDQNSQDPQDMDRNKGRKCVNDEILYRMGDIQLLDVLKSLEALYSLDLFQHERADYRQIVNKYISNDFDKNMYWYAVDLICDDSIPSYFLNNLNEENISENEDDKNINFSFLSTKAAVSNMLIDQEKDLIKKFFFKIECLDILRQIQDDSIGSLGTNSYYKFENPYYSKKMKFANPYYSKKMAEKFYLDGLKIYFHDENIEYDINANNLQTKKQAFTAALLDAENQNESVLDGKDEIFKKTYYETLALANAEIDAKAGRGRQNKLIKDKNIQDFYKKIYDDQYNEVIKQIGVYDSKRAYSHKTIANDPLAQQCYNEGYLNYTRKKAEIDFLLTSFDHFYKYSWDEAKKAYLGTFAVQLKERGRKFAHAKEHDKIKYKFDTIINPSECGEFYDALKKAYEQGVKEGLKEVELEKLKK